MSDEPLNRLDLPVNGYNLANNTKWIFYIPIGKLFNIQNENVKNGFLLDYPLNCRSVSFPEFKMGSSTVSFLNYSIDIPNHSNTTEKELTVTFALSENYLQYLVLLKWYELNDYTRYDQDRQDTLTIDLGDGILNSIAKTDYEKYIYSSGRNPYYSAIGPLVRL